jgi:putative ABC transport system permease protein
MIRNYIYTAVRNIWKDKTSSLINIVGLAISIAVCVLILQFSSFELSYDQFHHRASDVYRVFLDIYKNGGREAQSARVSPGVAAVFQDRFPAIDAYTRMVILGPDGVLTYKDRFSGESDILLADSSFFDVFSFNLVRGNQQTAFSEPFCVVITENTARTIFGSEDPIGKSVVINAKNFDGTSLPFKVTGVIENFPANTHLHPGVLISYPTLFEFVGHRFDDSWSWNETYTYFRLRPNTSPLDLEASFPKVVRQFNPQLQNQQLDWIYKLQPVTDIHLHSDLQHEVSVNGKAMYVYLLLTVGVVIILLAYINYINLVIVKAMQRAKEVGVRKVSGAYRTQIITQFFVESLLVNGIALMLAVIFSSLARPLIVNLFGITFSDTVFSHPPTWIGFSTLLLAVICGSGFYPALVLSGYKPIMALKGGYASGKSAETIRKLFVTGQFAIAMILIALTLATIVQVRFMQQQSLGFNPQQVMVIKAPKAHDYGYGSNFSGFQNKISQLAHVSSVSGSNVVPGQEIYWYDDQVTINGKETSGVFSMLAVSQNYFSHYGIPLIAGRLFTEIAEDQNRWIINESALPLLGFEHAEQALGQQLNNKEIIGVVKDFHHQSLKTAIAPILFTAGNAFNYYTVRLETDDLAGTVADIKEAYTKLFPGSPYEYFFLDEFLNIQYRAELLFNFLFGLFSGLAIFVACMGLFGLSSYLTLKRSKEIGIRKVMGASVASLVGLLTRDFTKLMVIAGIVATPIAYVIIERWVQNYAFRVEVTWWLLVAPVIVTLILALAVISLQTIRTALINPTLCLRHE